MVCAIEQANMESAELDFRTGLDGALRDDGSVRLADLETRGIRRATLATYAISRATRAQRPLDAALFRAALDGRCVRRNRAAVAGDCCNDSIVPSHQ